MDYSELIARLLGLYFVIMSIGMLLKPNTLKRNMEAIRQQPGLLAVASFFPLSFGLILVTTHNYWSLDWRVIITLFSWLFLIKGIVVFWFPAVTRAMYQAMMAKFPLVLRLAGITFLLLGGVLIYLSCM